MHRQNEVYQHHVPAQDGGVLCLDAAVCQIQFPDGNLERLLLIQLLSERRFSTSQQQQQQQQQQQECLYLALSNLPVAVTLINPSGKIIWQNGR